MTPRLVGLPQNGREEKNGKAEKTGDEREAGSGEGKEGKRGGVRKAENRNGKRDRRPEAVEGLVSRGGGGTQPQKRGCGIRGG